MGLVQQGWVGQSRGKMPLLRFYWHPWERHLAAIGARSLGRSRLEAAPTRRYALSSVPLFLLTLGDSLVSFRFEKRYDS